MAKAKHGKTATPEHKSWSGMKDRCLNPANCTYHKYGGRGITVHGPWINDFMAFYNYIGPKPSPEHSIGRIDNNGNYEPGNIRWATAKEQANNRSSNRQVEMTDGRLISTEQAAIELNMSPKTLMTRLHKGTPLDIPIRTHRSGVEYQGRHMTWKELSELHGIDVATIMKRTYVGMDIHDAISKPIQEHTAYSKSLTPEYRAWSKIKDRCLNPNSVNWNKYGAIGIKICDEWLNDFTAFYNHIGPKPSPEYSIDRINNDGNYEPGNVRWATPEQQANNRSTNIQVELPDGRLVSTKQAMSELNISKGVLFSRLYKGSLLGTPVQVSGSGVFRMKEQPEYNVWSKMKNRCNDPTNRAYHRYGGRGIKVCDRWKNSFMNFLSDMQPRPSDKHSIDRIDNDGNYEPGNCRWVTQDVQMNNVSYNRFVTLPNGEIVGTGEAAKRYNLNKGTLMNRLYKGIPLDQPLEIQNKKYPYMDKFLTISQLAAIRGFRVKTIHERIKSGMSPFDAANKPVAIKQKYYYQGKERSINEIAYIEAIEPFNIRYHLESGKTVEEAVNYVKDNKAKKEKMTALLKDDRYEYNLWCKLRAKYRNPMNPDYQYWGDKGYTICDRWYDSFFDFFEDIGRRPSKEHSFLHVDKTAELGPGNYQWTISDSNTRQINYKPLLLSDGKEVNINEAIALTGLPKSAIYYRSNNGIPIDAPIKNQHFYNGELYTCAKLADISGVTVNRLRKRLARGWSVEKAMIP